MNMLILKTLVRFLLVLRFHFHRLTRTGAFKAPGAKLVSHRGTRTANIIKGGLFKFHVKQFHESSCSVASLVCVVNTLLEKNHMLTSPAVTQEEILEKVRCAHWKERMGPGGYKGRKGLPLDVLGQVTQAALRAYGIPFASVETVRAAPDKGVQKELKAQLTRFETSGSCILIAHFDQGAFVRELNIPHISPVGGFDPATLKVTILDVDPSQPSPYEISFDRFFSGISTHYLYLFRLFGYGRGGYVLIRL